MAFSWASQREKRTNKVKIWLLNHCFRGLRCSTPRDGWGRVPVLRGYIQGLQHVICDPSFNTRHICRDLAFVQQPAANLVYESFCASSLSMDGYERTKAPRLLCTAAQNRIYTAYQVIWSMSSRKRTLWRVKRGSVGKQLFSMWNLLAALCVTSRTYHSNPPARD